MERRIRQAIVVDRDPGNPAAPVEVVHLEGVRRDRLLSAAEMTARMLGGVLWDINAERGKNRDG